jgi:hypothetical protein
MVPAIVLQEEFLVFVALLILIIELILLVVLFKMYFQLRGIHLSTGPGVLHAPGAGIPTPATIDAINESGHGPDPDRNRDISENLHRILDKYNLQRLTIAADDGLVVASSDAGAEDEAAALSHIYRSWGGSDTYTLTIFGIPHKEATLVGIVKRSGVLSENDLKGIETDTGLVISWYT